MPSDLTRLTVVSYKWGWVMIMVTDGPASSAARTAVSVALLAVPTLVAFSIPVLGFIVSLLLPPLIASRVRSRLWPRSSPRAALVCSVLVIAGLWLPALLSVLSVLSLEPTASPVWLLVPLCGPEQMSTHVIPALAATAASLAGAAASTLTRHPWPWVVAAWVAPLAYTAASRWLDGAFFC